MTKLPDEKLIDSLYIELIEYIYEVDKTELLIGSEIRKILQKHLTHPTDEGIEKTTNYDAACLYVVSKWLPINKDDVLWILKAAGKEVEGIEKEKPIIQEERKKRDNYEKLDVITDNTGKKSIVIQNHSSHKLWFSYADGLVEIYDNPDKSIEKEEQTDNKLLKQYQVIKTWLNWPSIGSIGYYDWLWFRKQWAFGTWSPIDGEISDYLEEVEPPTKDTIEKIDTNWYTIDSVRTRTFVYKINELVDKSNHQQEQIQQLLSGK